MKLWPLSKKPTEKEKEGEKTLVRAAGNNDSEPEKPVTVKMRSRPVLDVAVTLERFNPNFCSTFCSIIITAIVMGGCFVVVGVPPMYLDNWKGKRIYVGVMVPLLTLLCTVILYYVMQQPQRTFNTALMKMVKEMEYHSNYLSIAVDNVEKELNARGVNLSVPRKTSSFGGHPRSSSATTDDTPLKRAEAMSGTSLPTKPAAARSSSNYAGNGGTDFLRGIDKLEESHDVVIATVHVGKEWKWFKDVLEQLKKTTMAGPSFPGLTYQRVMVRMLTVAIARAEKLILSLYFSAVVLKRINILAPLNVWGTPVNSVAVSDSYRADMHARALTAFMKNGTTNAAGGASSQQQHALLRARSESGESLAESTFTIGNAVLKGSGEADSESPVFSAFGALDVRVDEETHMELTQLSQHRGMLFGRKAKLPQFTPLVVTEEATPVGTPQRSVSPLRFAQANEEEVEDRRKKKREALTVGNGGDRLPRWNSNSTSSAPLVQLSLTEMGRAANSGAPREPLVLPSSNEGSSKEVEDVDVEGVATPEKSTMQVGVGEASAQQHRSILGAVVDSNNNAHKDAPPPFPRAPTQYPRRQRQGEATPKQQQVQRAVVAMTGMPLPVDSPLPVKPPLLPLSCGAGCGGRSRRQPGTAVEQNPSLTLHRGSRFVKDEESFFMTILVHVQMAQRTCFSRLYAAQAHFEIDGTTKKHYFSNTGDACIMRRCYYNPFTLFRIGATAGVREGLTVREQQLLSFVYCRPEKHTEVDANDHRQPTDLSSLAVKDGAGNVRSPPEPEEKEESLSPVASETQRKFPSLNGSEEIDAFIVAMQLLAERPMRLTFLPVHVEAVAHNDASVPVNAGRPSLASTGITKNPNDGEVVAVTSEGGVANSDLDVIFPVPLKTVPVLECVIDDVLCVLTRMEVTVDSAFRKPSKILLVGVSLEDVSEGSERGVDADLDSLAEAHNTKKPSPSSMGNSPSERHTVSMTSSHLPTLDSLAPRTTAGEGYTHTCTVGQEFHEVITMEQDSTTAESSLATM